MILTAIFRVIGGLVMVVIGAGIVYKTEWMLSVFGRVDWAERHLGLEGGSRLFYKLLGVLICILGIMIATDLFRGFLLGTVGRLFVPGNEPLQ